MEDTSESCIKKTKSIPSPEDFKKCILDTKEPLIIRHILNWNLLKWTLNDWTEQLGNPILDVRTGSIKCTKVPQWERDCGLASAPLQELLDETKNTLSGKWMYFDYKHMKQYFKKNPELLESITWADFGFPDKNGEDSTIWIGTKGAYTPCHMDSYGCNIVAQVFGRKRWVLFPPSATSLLKPTRVPYEESSIYSKIHFACGLNIPNCLNKAYVVELSPGDVLIVPKNWWHYVENLTTAISINMWIPKDSDHSSRLEEALVRYFVGITLENLEEEKGRLLLNPNEIVLFGEPNDPLLISRCVGQVMAHQASCEKTEDTPFLKDQSMISVVSTLPVSVLQSLLLKKCGCVKETAQCNDSSKSLELSEEDLINSFCHPDVIAKVAEVLLASIKS